MLHLFDITLANLLALSAVIRVQSGNSGGRRKEDQPVTRRKFGTLFEP